MADKTKIKAKTDIKAALAEAAARRRVQAEIDIQKLAAKLAGGEALSDEELLRVDAALKAGDDPDAFNRAAAALAKMPELERRVSEFDFEGTARSIRTLETDLTRMITTHRAEEIELAEMLGNARLRALSADTAREKLAGIKSRWPHAFA